MHPYNSVMQRVCVLLYLMQYMHAIYACKYMCSKDDSITSGYNHAPLAYE